MNQNPHHAQLCAFAAKVLVKAHEATPTLSENGQRIHDASYAVAAYAATRGTTIDDDSEGSLLGDLLTDMMHWSAANGYDFDLALSRARGHFGQEFDPYAEAKTAYADGMLQVRFRPDEPWTDWANEDHSDEVPEFSHNPACYRRKPSNQFAVDHPEVVLERIAAKITPEVALQRELCQRWEHTYNANPSLRETVLKYPNIESAVETYMRTWKPLKH